MMAKPLAFSRAQWRFYKVCHKIDLGFLPCFFVKELVINMKIRVAILVNDEFFIKRHCSYFNKEISKTSAVDIVKCLKFIV